MCDNQPRSTLRVNQLLPIFYAMNLKMRETCKFAKCTISSRNFIKSQRLPNDGHIMNYSRTEGSSEYNLLTLYVQTRRV